MKDETRFGCSLDLSFETFSSAEDLSKKIKKSKLDVNPKCEEEDSSFKEGSRQISLCF